MGSDHCPTVVSIDELEVEIDDDYLPTFNMSKADWSSLNLNKYARTLFLLILSTRIEM